MLTAKKLWQKRRAQGKSLAQAWKLVEEKLLSADEIDHQSGSKMLCIDILISELGLTGKPLSNFVAKLNKAGYQAVLKNKELWEVEGKEEPHYLSITTYEK